MASIRIAVIPGDGIGPDLVTQLEKVINALNTRFQTGISLKQFPYGANYYLKSGISIPDEFIDEVAHNYDAILLGTLGDNRIPDMKHALEIVFKLRERLNLTMSIQPVRLFQSWLATQKDIETKTVDYLIIKEIFESTINSADQIYLKGRESAVLVQSGLFTAKNIRVFIQNVFEYLQKHHRARVCFVDQGLKFRQSQMLWNTIVAEVQDKYPEIKVTNKLINGAIKDILLNPDDSDAYIATSDNGDVLAAISSIIMGGYGLSYSIEVNPELISVYRILQASSTKLSGSNTINPFGTFLILWQILSDNGNIEESDTLMAALMTNFSNHWVTMDLGGIMGTDEVTDYICGHISNKN